MGDSMLYSSGTTGRPKGILRAAAGDQRRRRLRRSAQSPMSRLYGFDGDTVYLSPAPLYHAAPLGYVHQRARATAARW